jgi:hypothetical protein
MTYYTPQNDLWKEASLTADLHELEHVVTSHVENALPLEAVLRLDKETLAKGIIRLREDLHREMEQNYEEDKMRDEEDARLAHQRSMNLRDWLEASGALREGVRIAWGESHVVWRVSWNRDGIDMDAIVCDDALSEIHISDCASLPAAGWRVVE